MKRHFLFAIIIIILLGLSGLTAATAAANNTNNLHAKLVNLTKENRELKAELANLTKQYNQLKAENEFLKQQNAEYRKLIQGLLKEQAQKSEQNYIEKARKERLIGSVIIKALIFSLAVVGLIGFLLYRKKRSWEYPL